MANLETGNIAQSVFVDTSSSSEVWILVSMVVLTWTYSITIDAFSYALNALKTRFSMVYGSQFHTNIRCM